ncbi:MAG TPA: hypothetical protein VE546_01205 [Streptomyces sp.]|uniref:hypothetical protein n=1 Tax=Streptomyces sp. TaxID=1931 RepID=UPI002D413C9B|nr:hypothetical protein [Streptomyces sp.]HZG02188.1 hypothetical protein [Streptomyces sp.]
MPDKTTHKTANKVNDIRKVLADPTPLYFAAGVIDKIREVAPERLAAVKGKAADPKAVQERFTQQAKQTQSKLTAVFSGLDTDLKKLRDQAQHLALQGVGLAAEYAVKAREGYGELAERGRGAVKTWRGEKNGAAAGKAPLQTARERNEVVVLEEEEEKPQARTAAGARGRAARTGTAKKTETETARQAAAKRAAARKSTTGTSGAAKKTTASRPTPKTVAKTASRPPQKQAAQKQTAQKQAAEKQDKPES